jgi:signal transduction histidine kinase
MPSNTKYWFGRNWPQISPGHGVSCAVTAAADESHNQWHRCDQGRGGGARTSHQSQRAEDEQLLVSVSDTGAGLSPKGGQIFAAFVTIKPHGTGMEHRISRSIVESHGGRLWAAANPLRGANFHFTLPLTIRYFNDNYS